MNRTFVKLFVLMGLVSAPLLRAQFDAASVLGTVRDASGALVAGVAVTLKNTETGITATTRTDNKGDYQFLTVKIGKYEITATQPGFSSAVVNDIVLTVNARQRVDLTLQVGAVNDKVVVTG